MTKITRLLAASPPLLFMNGIIKPFLVIGYQKWGCYANTPCPSTFRFTIWLIAIWTYFTYRIWAVYAICENSFDMGNGQR